MLEIKNIIKKYHMTNHEVLALDDISFKIEPGNLVAIVGPSGCGKTSLMNIIGAMDSDFEGDVIINGNSLKNTKDKDSYRKNEIGFIFQNFTLINSLTSLQNVVLPLQISGESKKDFLPKAKDLLTAVGLENHLNKKVNLLSGGQKQRVAIARALANEPNIILADEPTGALDEKTGLVIMEMLKNIAQEKIVVMVTHSPEIADKYADVIISMEDGKIINIDNKKEQNVDLSKIDKDEDEKKKSKSSMSYFTSLKLALRNFKIKKARTIWTSVGLSIGIIGIALALALSSGTKQTIENQVYSIFPANMISVTHAGSTAFNNKNLNYQDYLKVKDIVGENSSVIFIPINIFPLKASLDKDSVKIDSMQDMMSGFNNNDNDEKDKDKAKSIMPGAINLIQALEGDIAYGKSVKNSNEVVLSFETAENLLDENQKMEDLLNKNMYINYFDMDNGVSKISKVTIVGIGSNSTMLNTLYFNEDYYPKMLNDLFDIKQQDIETRTILVYKKLDSNQTIQDFVKDANKESKKLNFEGASESILNTVGGILDGVRNGLIAFSSVSVFVAIIMIAIVVYISVIERQQEIGIIRALGGRKKDVRNLFLSESLIIGVLAGIIGLIISYLLCIGINNIVHSIMSSMSPNTPFMEVANLEFTTALILLVLCAFISIIAGLIPSQKAANLDPIEAIRKK